MNFFSIKRVIPLCIFILFITSCKKDFLDTQVTTSILRQEYVTDIKTLHSYLKGGYVKFSENFLHGYNTIYGELVADNVIPVTGSSIFSFQYQWAQLADDRAQYSPANSSVNMNALWTSGYIITRACSFVIENTDKYREENPQLADDIKGQAYALRAYVHFVMMNIFAQPYSYSENGTHSGIPYVTSSDWTQAVTRSSVADNYNNLIDDLQSSLPLFSASLSNTLQFNYNASLALLARVYLFKGDFQSSKNAARQVITTVPLMTINYPSKLFTPQETEALFQVQPAWTNVTAGAGTFQTWFSGVYYAAPLKQFNATSDIATLLTQNPNDIRKSWVIQSGTSWQVAKYPSNVIAGFPAGTLSYYFTLLRSSEMYLTAAESYAKLNQEDSAKFFLDKIRMRADQTAMPSTASGNALLDSIYNERRREFAFEGTRLFDLQRWKKAITRMGEINSTYKTLEFPSPKRIAPLPTLDVNNAGLSQNESY